MQDQETLGLAILLLSEHKKHILTAAWIFFGINSWMQVENILRLRAKRKLDEIEADILEESTDSESAKPD